MDRSNRSARRWEYIGFDLEVRRGGQGEYSVSVRSSSGDVVREEIRLPLDKWQEENKLLTLENALLRSGGRRSTRSPEEQNIQDFGQDLQEVQDFGQGLFKALLVGEVLGCYRSSLREAKQQNKGGVRLKLRIEPPELAYLPWEFLYDPSRKEYLCLSSKTPLVRSPDLPQPVEQLRVKPPLRILGMVANPLDLDPLDVGREKQLVEDAIKDLQAKKLVELSWVEGQTWRDLQRAMRSGPWHIFHFTGHGGFDPASEKSAVALADDMGYARFLRGEDLARLLKDHWDLRLVMLNSCEGAKGSERDVFSSTAATLVRPGIPAVLAMRYEISDEAAIEFSRAFYEAVAGSQPVDAAVAEARSSVKIELGDTLEWGTPVLYMRSEDGRIFDVQEKTEEEEDLLGRYRECVKSAWADRELNEREVEWLSNLSSEELGLSPSDAAGIEREVMGDTKEAILKRLDPGAREGPSVGDSEQESKQGFPFQIFSFRRRAVFLLAGIMGVLLVLGGAAFAAFGPGANWGVGSKEELRTAVETYYKAVDDKDWNYTYDNLDSKTKQMFTKDEWIEKNQYFDGQCPIEHSRPAIGSEDAPNQVNVSVTLTFTGCDPKYRNTAFVYEDGTWKHRFLDEELDTFKPGVPFE